MTGAVPKAERGVGTPMKSAMFRLRAGSIGAAPWRYAAYRAPWPLSRDACGALSTPLVVLCLVTCLSARSR